MLKSKETEEGYAALSEGEQKHYTKDATGAYILQHDEAVTLKRALNTERTRAERSEKLLKALVPDLPEDKSEWEGVIAEQAETLKELRAVDLDEWKSFKAEPGDPKDPKQRKADWEAERLELQKSLREAVRERDAHKKDLDKIGKKVDSLSAENLSLAQEKALNAALDAVKITDPQDREVVTALMLKRGLEPQEVTGKGRVFFVKSEDGSEIELGEAAKDFVSTDFGKRYVKAPDSSGGGEGAPAPVRPVGEKTFESMNPSQKLAAVLGPGVGGQGGQPPAPSGAR